MPTLDELLSLRDAAEYVFNGLMCGCIQMSVEASRAHRELVDRFFLEYEGCADPAEYGEARLNIFHFIELVDRAIADRRGRPLSPDRVDGDAAS